MTLLLSRIRFGLAASAIALLSGCMSSDGIMGASFAGGSGITDFFREVEAESPVVVDDFADSHALGYAAVEDGGFQLAAIPTTKMDPKYLRQQVPSYEAGEYPPGTVVVDTPNRFLYLIEEGGTAMRYGISVGGAGFSWAGDATVQMRREWPRWNPPQEMIDRKPELEPYRNGMDAGLQNPLGARALYLFQGGRDTLYRLHGTPEWWTIGNAVSSGCIRLTNQDIIDLYERVPDGARVVVKQGNERLVGEEEEILEEPSGAAMSAAPSPDVFAQSTF